MLSVSCNNSTEETSLDAYIGGQIRNPSSNNVILLKNNVPLDTIRLDFQNRFSYRIKSVEDGLYLFKHAPFSQVVYLKGGDSLLLRANSLEFQLDDTRIGKDAFQYYLNKSLFLNASGEVVFGDAYINSPEFETRILELLNQ